MRVFVTGASGWIGSAVVAELLAAGHEVTGLARSDASAAALAAAGVAARRGDLDDPESLRAAAADADGVIHLAFKHDFGNYAAAGVTEHTAVEAMAGALEGSDRPFLLASGLAHAAPGQVLTESHMTDWHGPESMRGGSENLALGYAEKGVRAVSLRFAPSVHGAPTAQGAYDHGFVGVLAQIARTKGVAGYIGDGSGRWPAVNRLDAGKVVALALEKAAAGTAVHAVGEEGIPTREIAEALSRSIGVPTISVSQEDAAEHFGFLAGFYGQDIRASSARTRELLGWTPTHPGLIEDIDAGHYPGN
jgi:nucleoside-diphosphate-sugar epimerase